MKSQQSVVAIIGLCLAVMHSASAIDGKHINGRAVSVQWRHGWLDWSAACCECYGNSYWGSIDLFTITNGRVTKTDTIWNRTQGEAGSPAFNLDGTKIAFYRSSEAATSGTGCATVNGGKNSIAVIDITGGTPTNLCDLPAGTSLPSENGLDWPAGEFIYYVMPKPNNPESMEIWKVNYRTKDNTKVCNFTAKGQQTQCTYFRRFSLDLGVDHMAAQCLQRYNCTDASWFCNDVVPFPGNCNINASGGGCNITISPSGNYDVRFNGDHALSIFDKTSYAPASAINPPGGVYLSQWQATTTDQFGIDVELMRWAVNSDKWYLQQVGWFGHASAIGQGSESVACNWADMIAIRISNNGKWAGDPSAGGSGVIAYCNEPGDLWVDGGADNVGKYEDGSGSWHAAPGYVPTVAGYAPVASAATTAMSATIDTRASIHIALPFTSIAQVSLLDTRGSVVRTARGAHEAVLSAAGLAKGVYMITAHCGNAIASTPISLAR